MAPTLHTSKSTHSEDSEKERETGSEASGSESGSLSGDDDASTDTEDGIAGAKSQKSKKTLKRKRRATDTTRFGSTLKFLLATETPSDQPLSLRPAVAQKRNEEKLEIRARKALQVEKKEKEDKGRITDVIGGWGAESERGLRKIAQRGVVQLFNAIQQSQNAAEEAQEDTKAIRGSGKPTLPAPSFDPLKKKSQKDNALGRGKSAAVEKDQFFDLIRSGGVVSNA